MKVILLAHTKDPDVLVAGAAKLCYSNSGVQELLGGLDAEKAGEFVEMLGELGHESPTEHASFTFGIEGVSRSLLAQLTRHRLASYSVQSQRYVKLEDFGYVTPPAIANNAEAAEIYERAMRRDAESYERIAEILADDYCKELIAAGTPEKKARSQAEKKAIEDARFVLPNACETKLIVTMNARSLENFFRHRCCNRAQWEIRALANEMLKLVKGVAPNLFKNSGPGCVGGACPEGKMSCGKADEVRRFYAALSEQAKT